MGHPKYECRCSFLQIQRYRSKIPGPLMDRIDIYLGSPPCPTRSFPRQLMGPLPAEILQSVMKARDIQSTRLA
ncbi:MAG: ATP-binding protein [Desulfobacteraceae bacterium]|nr:ATP-binding protein [Desulfobacteraceae bacterium]